MRNNRTIIIAIVALLVLAVGGVIFFRGNEQGLSAVSESDPVQATVQEMKEVVQEPTQEPATVVVQATEETLVEETLVPTPKSGLLATDPSTVALASGQLQLVEAFAFW